jgi:hypothetical protein
MSNWDTRTDGELVTRKERGLLHLMLRMAGLGAQQQEGTSSRSSSRPGGAIDDTSPLLHAIRRMLLQVDPVKSTSDNAAPSKELQALLSASTSSSSLLLCLVDIATSLFAAAAQAATLAKTAEEVCALQGVNPVANIAPVTMESAHEYENNTDNVRLLSLPGATGLEIVFDENCSTEVSLQGVYIPCIISMIHSVDDTQLLNPSQTKVSSIQFFLVFVAKLRFRGLLCGSRAQKHVGWKVQWTEV